MTTFLLLFSVFTTVSWYVTLLKLEKLRREVREVTDNWVFRPGTSFERAKTALQDIAKIIEK